jgi:hypothetical protein
VTGRPRRPRAEGWPLPASQHCPCRRAPWSLCPWNYRRPRDRPRPAPNTDENSRAWKDINRLIMADRW